MGRAVTGRADDRGAVPSMNNIVPVAPFCRTHVHTSTMMGVHRYPCIGLFNIRETCKLRRHGRGSLGSLRCRPDVLAGAVRTEPSERGNTSEGATHQIVPDGRHGAGVRSA
jgi:hypothetical protein